MLSGTGETMIIVQKKKKREENHRGAGSQGKTFFVKRNTGGQKETSVRGVTQASAAGSSACKPELV